jgi:hypothetical protein
MMRNLQFSNGRPIWPRRHYGGVPKGSSRSPESVAGFRRLVAIAIIRRGATSTFKRPRFIKGLNRNFSSK